MWPDGILWGKWDEKTQTFLSLIDHSADVAAVTERLLTHTQLGTRLARLGGLDALSEPLIETLSFFAAIHDFGKVAIPFQRQIFPDFRDYRHRSHVQAALNLLRSDPSSLQNELFEHLPTHLMPLLGQGPDRYRELCKFLIATVCHHGTPYPQLSKFNPDLFQPAFGLDPKLELLSLVKQARRWFPKTFDPALDLPTDPAFQHGWNGVLNLADWVGSTQTFFPFETPTDQDRLTHARERATKALRHIGLDVTRARAALPITPGFDRISHYPPRRAQAEIGRLEPDARGSTAVLEASTGSGKTEGALWHFARLFKAGWVDGFYFALPTRSAASQIQERVETLVRERLLPELALDDRPAVIQAVPGYLRADGLIGERLPGFEVLWSDAQELPDSRRSESTHRAWAAEHGKRYLAGAFVVGTIDQALMAGLQVKHTHLRAASLMRHLLIVDEVHASDIYMRKILEQVLKHHRRAGGHALLMSATLGSEARQALLNAGQGTDGSLAGKRRRPTLSLEQALDVPYPMVQIQRGDSLDPPIQVSTEGFASKEVRIGHRGFKLIDQPERIAELALGAAALGARVLVIRNTVKGCRAVQAELEKSAAKTDQLDLLFGITVPGRGHVPSSHHSRYSREDRRALDLAVESTFSKSRSGPYDGSVAIATQTVEQSLDIDADLLITDLCPMDVLLQRIGRLFRHEIKGRPTGFREPCVEVLTPDIELATLLRENGSARTLHGLGNVYPDLRILQATLQQIPAGRILDLPSQNRELVERATHPEALKALDADSPDRAELWKSHWRHVTGAKLSMVQMAKVGLLRWKEHFGCLSFAHLEKSIRTRLGELDILVGFPDPPAGPFGRPVETLSIRPYELDLDDDVRLDDRAQAEKVVPDDDGFNFEFSGIRFRYDRFGLRRLLEE